MFREMRRQDRATSLEEAKEIVRTQNHGVLSVIGDEGYPYGVPVNYGYVEDKIYIHSTSESSHKIDAITANPKVCLTVIAKHDLIEQELTTAFRSAVVFGTARIITDMEEKQRAIYRMMMGLAPKLAEHAKEHCKGTEHTFSMIEITPEHITGKARK